MSRTGLNKSAHLNVIVSGDPRANESTQWNLTRGGLLAQVNQGVLSASAWGLTLPLRTLPIVGSETKDTYEQAYLPAKRHETYFEQVNLSTAGAGTASDKYILHVKFALANMPAEPVTVGATSGTATIGGKVQIELINSGGSQVLYSAHSTAVSAYGVSSNDPKTPTPGGVTQYEIVQEGTISGGMIPAPGETRDSKIRVTFSDSAYNGVGVSITSDYQIDSKFGTLGDYIGVFGYSFKLYNEGV